MFLANCVPKCQMSSGPYGPIFGKLFALPHIYFILVPFREVFKARDKSTRRLVALKKVLMENEKEGVGIQVRFWISFDYERNPDLPKTERLYLRVPCNSVSLPPSIAYNGRSIRGQTQNTELVR